MRQDYRQSKLLRYDLGNKLMDDILAVKLTMLSVTAIFQLPPELQQQAIQAYSSSLDRVFLIGVPAGALASVSGL